MTERDVAYDENGLVPAIVQDAQRGTVLMLAYMNAEALRLTRETGIVHFWSRSRQSLWKKGETSGNTLALVELRIDCDADTVLVRANPAGPTCHTGTTTCFFHRDDGPDDDGVPAVTTLEQLDKILQSRRDSSTGEKSHTKSLLEAGESGSVLDMLLAQRRLIAEALLNAQENTRPQFNNELNKLHRLIAEEEAREVAAAQEEAERADAADDEAFDPKAV